MAEIAKIAKATKAAEAGTVLTTKEADAKEAARDKTHGADGHELSTGEQARDKARVALGRTGIKNSNEGKSKSGFLQKRGPLKVRAARCD